jgi:hypothetical protein
LPGIDELGKHGIEFTGVFGHQRVAAAAEELWRAGEAVKEEHGLPRIRIEPAAGIVLSGQACRAPDGSMKSDCRLQKSDKLILYFFDHRRFKMDQRRSNASPILEYYF